jgi:hypothetical protein
MDNNMGQSFIIKNCFWIYRLMLKPLHHRDTFRKHVCLYGVVVKTLVYKFKIDFKRIFFVSLKTNYILPYFWDYKLIYG